LEPASVMEFGTNQLRTCSEPAPQLASVVEFGFNENVAIDSNQAR